MIIKLSGNKKIYIIISLIMVILWMGLILSFSGDEADVSKSKSGFVLERVEPIISATSSIFMDSPMEKDNIHRLIRKTAHMFNYFILAILILNAFRYAFMSSKRKYFITLIITFIFASIDEFYQSFIPGRSGELRDVVIDNLGSIIGIILVFLIVKLKVKIKEENINSRI